MQEMLYTVPEVAKILKTNTAYVYKLKDSGQLKFLKLGRLKVRKETLERFLANMDGMDITDPFNIHELQEGETDEVVD
ncbi:MAG: helix-turn-helix domain-containing protein [Holdemanella sp.]|nr:helix-turn-helix domain-containing protein [Holdemanella sp.]